MTTYPFSRNPQENKFPDTGSWQRIENIGNTTYEIELDVNTLKKHFPLLIEEGNEQDFLEKIWSSIVTIDVRDYLEPIIITKDYINK